MKLNMNIVKLIIGIVGFLIWSAMAYYDQSLRSDYLKFVIAIVMGLVGLVVRDMPSSPPPKE